MSTPTVIVSSLPKGTSYARFIMALGASGGRFIDAREKAAQWRDTPQVAETLDHYLRYKSAVPAGSTQDASWAGPLSPFGVGGEALTLMRAQSILGALEGSLIRVPFHVQIAHETGAGVTGGWVGPGMPIPVQQTAFDIVVNDLYKFAVIVPLSRELMKFSNPSAEETVRRTTLGGLAQAIDLALLLPTAAAVPGVSPGSITAGATEVITTGSTAAAIRTDLVSLMTAITTKGPRTWIMSEKTRGTLASALGTDGATLPRSLFSFPVIVSANSPAQITIIDGTGVIYADANQFDVDVSTDAALQLDTAPANPPTAATVISSLWPTNLVAVRVMRWLAWRRIESGSVAFMTVGY